MATLVCREITLTSEWQRCSAAPLVLSQGVITYPAERGGAEQAGDLRLLNDVGATVTRAPGYEVSCGGVDLYNVLVQGVAGDEGALGYFGIAYYEENREKIRALKIGDGVLVTAPMEMLTQVGLNVKAMSPFAHTFVVALTNGYLHYAAPAAYYPRGGYEVNECLLAPEWEEIFYGAVRELFAELQAQD